MEIESSETDDSRNELIRAIRETLGIFVYGPSSTISDVSLRRITETLEALPHEQLEAVLAVSKKAASQYDGTEEQSAEGTFGNDIYRLRDHLYNYELKKILLLATALDGMPEGMPVLEAISTISTASNAVFDLSAGDKIVAHLKASHYLRTRFGRGYTLHQMMLIQTHPDKLDIIVELIGRGNSLPTNAEIILYQSVEPVLYDGVL